jgi:hypothetical protein
MPGPSIADKDGLTVDAVNPARPKKVNTMARVKKQSSLKLELANTRAAGLESIDPALDLGNGMTLVAYRAKITDTATKLSAYNTKLSEADDAQNAFQEAELVLADMSERMLAGAAAKYGKDSTEYEMAGGMKKSDRRRKTSVAVTAASAAAK